MEVIQSCWQVPSIAHFCKLFQNTFNLPDISYEDLEFAFLSKVSVASDQQDFGLSQDNLLRNLVIALLNKYFSHQSINILNWESYLKKVFQIQCANENRRSPFTTLDDEALSFDDLSLQAKADVVHSLCGYILLREEVCEVLKDIEADEFRIEPLGKDSKGYDYWYFYGTRLYRENPTVAAEVKNKLKKIEEIEKKEAEIRKKEAEVKKKKEEEEARRQKQLEEKKAKEEQAKKTPKRSLPPKVAGYRTGLRERKSQVNGVCLNTCTANNSKKVKSETPKSEKSVKSVKKKQPEVEKKPEISNEELKESWSIICQTEQDWYDLADTLKKSRSQTDQKLYQLLSTNFLTQISEIFAKKEREEKQKQRQELLCLLPRRVSSRIEIKKLQKEQEEKEEQEAKRRKFDEGEVAKQKAKEKAERIKQEQLKLERERRAQQRLKMMEERAERALLRQEQGLRDLNEEEFDAELENEETNSLDMQTIEFPEDLPEEGINFYEALEKVIAAVIANRDAWPFRDPVDEKEAPMYYHVIEEPIDLKTIEEKIENKQYCELKEVELDFKLMVNNCETYNGPKNGYTLMAYAVWRAFKRAVKKHLKQDLSLDEQTVFIYPPKPVNTNIMPAIEAKKKKSRSKRRLASQALDVLAEASERAIKDTSSMSSMSASSPRSCISFDEPSCDSYSMDSNDNKSLVYGNVISRFLSNSNNVNNNVSSQSASTAKDNLTFKSLEEWSKTIKQSGNSVVLPQHTVIISSAPVTSTTNTNKSFEGPRIASLTNSNKIFETNPNGNFLTDVGNTQKNASSEDSKRLVIKLSRSETGESWKPVQEDSRCQSENQIVNDNKIMPPFSASDENPSQQLHAQGLRSIPNNCVPVKKRAYHYVPADKLDPVPSADNLFNPTDVAHDQRKMQFSSTFNSNDLKNGNVIKVVRLKLDPNSPLNINIPIIQQTPQQASSNVIFTNSSQTSQSFETNFSSTESTSKMS